jgi:hypothetical protein
MLDIYIKKSTKKNKGLKDSKICKSIIKINSKEFNYKLKPYKKV